MKTVLVISPQIQSFFGTALLESMTAPKSFLDRARGVRLLRKSAESNYSNLETRIAFVSIVQLATDKDERDSLIILMGICRKTFYNWRKDYTAYIEGTLKTRTVVIRK